MQLGYSSMTAGIYDLDEAFRCAAELDLQFVELSYDACNFLPDAQPAQRVLELSRATGIATTLHLPFIDLNIASLAQTVRCAAVTQTQRALEYAATINARCAVLHTGTYFIYQPVPKQASFDALLDSLTSLNKDVPVVLENLGLYVDSLVSGPDELSWLSSVSGLDTCLDFGHAYIEAGRPWQKGQTGDPIKDYISALGERIVHLHLCNNDGATDLHTATPEGTIDYEAYRDFLQTFTGTICLEVAGGVESVRKSAQHLNTFRALDYSVT